MVRWLERNGVIVAERRFEHASWLSDRTTSMCRLYGFRATEETKVECTLVHAQNALIVQAEGDLTGREHAHGWGVATYRNGTPKVEKQASPAFYGEHFSRVAERAHATTAVAHVRRATVGGTGLENTHPFHHGSWVFATGPVPSSHWLDASSTKGILRKGKSNFLS